MLGIWDEGVMSMATRFWYRLLVLGSAMSDFALRLHSQFATAIFAPFCIGKLLQNLTDFSILMDITQVSEVDAHAYSSRVMPV